MDSDSSKDSKQVKSKEEPNQPIQRYGVDVGSILQSFWIRCRSVFPTITNREFMEGELRIVLYSGCILWGLYMAWEIIRS
jgi:hypothetical protein